MPDSGDGADEPSDRPSSGGPPMEIAELKQKGVTELHELGQQLNISNYSGLRKQDLIFRIEQTLLEKDTVIRGEGVVEILPEGYGFLRSQGSSALFIRNTDPGWADKLNGSINMAGRAPGVYRWYVGATNTENGTHSDQALVFQLMDRPSTTAACADYNDCIAAMAQYMKTRVMAGIRTNAALDAEVEAFRDGVYDRRVIGLRLEQDLLSLSNITCTTCGPGTSYAVITHRRDQYRPAGQGARCASAGGSCGKKRGRARRTLDPAGMFPLHSVVRDPPCSSGLRRARGVPWNYNERSPIEEEQVVSGCLDCSIADNL